MVENILPLPVKTRCEDTVKDKTIIRQARQRRTEAAIKVIINKTRTNHLIQQLNKFRLPLAPIADQAISARMEKEELFKGIYAQVAQKYLQERQ